MKSILFVCMGNICRSPTAEAVFRKLAFDAGRAAEFEIDSAGTIDYHAGSPADSRMKETATQYGYNLDSIARKIVPGDFQRFDLIIIMDDDNFHAVNSMDPGNGAWVVKMWEYCEEHEVTAVPDPYYGGEDGFHRVISILEDACASLLVKT
jgi:protein-tyrosine phosphatase